MGHPRYSGSGVFLVWELKTAGPSAPSAFADSGRDDNIIFWQKREGELGANDEKRRGLRFLFGVVWEWLPVFG